MLSIVMMQIGKELLSRRQRWGPTIRYSQMLKLWRWYNLKDWEPSEEVSVAPGCGARTSQRLDPSCFLSHLQDPRI